VANQAGRPIAPARKLVALVMGTIAAFLTVFGAGLASWAVVVFGVALLALSIALGMVNTVRRGARAWVAGSAEVKAISPPPTSSSAVYGRAEIQVVIVAPGLPTSEVTVHEPRVPVAKWPDPGDTLPITVDVDDMRRVRIDWDEAGGRPTGEDPPPPSSAPGTYGDPDDQLDDDLLGEVGEPPWQARPDDWDRPADAYDESPVVVHDTPGGRIVEGELVDADDELPPLPRRAPASRHSEAAASAGLDDDLADQAGAGPADPEPTGESPAGETPLDAGYDPSESSAGPAATAWAESNAGSRSASSGPEAYSNSATGPSADPASASASAAGPSSAPPSAPASPSSSGPSFSAPTATPGPAPSSGAASYSGAAPSSGGRPAAAADAGFAAGAAATRATGSRPSPRPRPRGTGTATVEAEPIATPPAQRSPYHDDSFPTDVPLDDPLPPEAPAQPTPAAGTQAADPDSADASAVRDRAAEATTAGAGSAPGSPWRRPEPTRAPATPSPMSSFPTAPPPVTPPPTAPAPTTGRPKAPKPTFTPIDDIDVPLDGDPDVPPESTPAAAESLAEDLIAPAPDVLSAADPDVLSAPSTRFTTNAAHEATVPTESIPIQAATSPEPPRYGAGAVVAGAAAAVGAAVAAVKRLGHPHEQAPPAALPEPSSSPADAAPQAAPTEPVTEPVAASAAEAAIPSRQSDPTPIPSQRPDPTPIPSPQPDPAAIPSPSPEPETPAAEAAFPAAGAAEAAAEQTRPEGSPWADLTRRIEPDDRADDLITAYPSARPGPGGAIHGVGITILVTDLDRSVAFYRDLLGFFVIDSGAGSAVLASGDTRLVLRTVDGLSAEPGRLIYLNLEVGDVEASYEDLKSKGVRFVHDPRAVNRGERLELWSATFEDPDGHNVAITQWRAAR
jgi:catechol 2,3-dioxygenase-like lactoylglutathione lyase family enzyme